MLRIGEDRANSSWASIVRHARAVECLTGDLRRVIDSKSLPQLDTSRTPVVEQWFIEKFIVPTLVGFITYPGDSGEPHGERSSSFTAPLHIFSLRQGIARSAQRWYRIGHPSPVAEDSLRRWSMDGEI
ncbi:hypothetical protein QC756_13095 [Sinorhizobium meliloti]|uniref:hypothetical protein n=1 Tax=Rhizobium meliloti TaxID=382 RepID=UPI00244D99EA|nr:hypothetical protein [Sinorhizobium meliloti]WGI73301.1 hypothetical protein QC756_13095 [Sinorhizobium meliloti]